jgi:hypothetical protein
MRRRAVVEKGDIFIRANRYDVAYYPVLDLREDTRDGVPQLISRNFSVPLLLLRYNYNA